MERYLVLIVDDEPDILELLSLTLERMNIDSRSAADLAQAKHLLDKESFDLCLTDMRLPDGDGIELVRHISEHYTNTPVAVITAHGNMELAVTALKAGAFDFVSKPVDLTRLRQLVNAAMKLSAKTPHAEPARGSDALANDPLLGNSDVMQRVRATIKKLARSQAPVYISGESGSGKELVARMIHTLGPRADQPFIPVNCGAIPPELMESEFFGHKKGSFTGAIADKDGLFQAADGGTLFLDEVAELPLPMQVKLLRAIQEKSVRPVGEQTEQLVDVRILSATHKDLAKLVTDGEFRQDLFYRINVIELPVPALRERTEDIEELADHILTRLAGQRHPRLSKHALDALQHYSFPGNVRELENILERAMTLCEADIIDTDDLQLPQNNHGETAAGLSMADIEAHKPADMPLEDYLDSIEKEAIMQALEQTRYNKTAAAKLLGITFRALRYRLKKLGLE